jgi:hypothetical protein
MVHDIAKLPYRALRLQGGTWASCICTSAAYACRQFLSGHMHCVKLRARAGGVSLTAAYAVRPVLQLLHGAVMSSGGLRLAPCNERALGACPVADAGCMSDWIRIVGICRDLVVLGCRCLETTEMPT